MNELLAACFGSLWLGILTSISPCPLATNVAAISYIGNKVGDTRQIIYSGLLYTFGRMLTYIVLGILIISSLLSIPSVSQFLQKYMDRLLGPILILAGMMLTGLLRFEIPGSGVREKTANRIDKMGLLGALFLGILFALSFCPVSAALFFGSLISMALKNESRIFLPAIYGIGTGLPVIAFAFILGTGAGFAGKFFRKIQDWEIWARKLTGILFILIGVYFCLKYIFKII